MYCLHNLGQFTQGGDFLFLNCSSRDSKRPLRSKEQSGGLFVGRVRVGERRSEPSESRNPLQTKTLTKIGECFLLLITHIF